MERATVKEGLERSRPYTSSFYRATRVPLPCNFIDFCHYNSRKGRTEARVSVMYSLVPSRNEGGELMIDTHVSSGGMTFRFSSESVREPLPVLACTDRTTEILMPSIRKATRTGKFMAQWFGFTRIGLDVVNFGGGPFVAPYVDSEKITQAMTA